MGALFRSMVHEAPRSHLFVVELRGSNGLRMGHLVDAHSGVAGV